MSEPGFGELDSEMQDAVLFAERILRCFKEEWEAGRPTPLTSVCALVLSFCWDNGIDWHDEMERARRRFPFHAIGSAEPRRAAP